MTRRTWMPCCDIPTADLMKKGLRYSGIDRDAPRPDSNRRPDEEGIKTPSPGPNTGDSHSNRRPDEEGIKTDQVHQLLLPCRFQPQT